MTTGRKKKGQGQASAPQPEIRPSQASAPRAPDAAPEYPPELRDGGRWTKGGPSPFPGGRGLASVKLARRVREIVDLDELIRGTWEIATGRARFQYVEIGRVASATEGAPAVDGPIVYEAGPSPELQLAARRELRQWGYGKGFPAAADLIEAREPATEPMELDEAALLRQGLEATAGILSELRGHVRAGGLPDPQIVQGLRGALEALASIHKQTREVERMDPVSRMPLDQVLAAALEKMPAAVLEAELARRKAAGGVA